ncbi:hypothetical protein RJ641_025002 [Dillenia turbinata]|uniref:Glycosyltransferase N-terminal domain-containing protein n=1 Tax=Dillenia turbinata TaxID=194707 RepID=A0AAN8W1Z6_9MAGN
MASPFQSLHFVLVPLMSPGHLTPMIDIAKLLAQHGVIVSIVTTPLNTLRFKKALDRAIADGLKIRLLELQFPAVEAGLPEECESMEGLTSRELIGNFFVASSMLQKPLENLLDAAEPQLSCIISGKNLAWTADVARKYKIPRLFFDGMGCFAFSCSHHLEKSNICESVSRFESFVIPGLPDRIELTKAQLPENFNPGPTSPELHHIRKKFKELESAADGVLVNSFEELEPAYVKEYRKAKDGKVWCIGPVSAVNKLELDKGERGRQASIEINQCLEWLDSWTPSSVVYASLGSICGLSATQLGELALEAAVSWGVEERAGIVMKTEGVKKAIEQVMDESEEGRERRKMAKELAEVAKNAIEASRRVIGFQFVGPVILGFGHGAHLDKTPVLGMVSISNVILFHVEKYELVMACSSIDVGLVSSKPSVDNMAFTACKRPSLQPHCGQSKTKLCPFAITISHVLVEYERISSLVPVLEDRYDIPTKGFEGLPCGALAYATH